MLNLRNKNKIAESSATSKPTTLGISKQATSIRLRPKNSLNIPQFPSFKSKNVQKPPQKLPLVSKNTPSKVTTNKNALNNNTVQIYHDQSVESVDESFETAKEALEDMETSLDESALQMEEILDGNPITDDEISILIFNDTTYLHNIYDYNRQREKVTKADNYLRKQKEISTDMRTILIDWLIEVSFSSPNNYYSHDVLPLATNIIDRFLSRMGVPKTKLQLLGIVCLMLGSKMLDTIPPDVLQLCELTDNTYSSSQVKRMEILVLETLNFDLYPPCHSDFFNYYLQVYSQAAPDIDQTAIDRSPKAIKTRTYSSLVCQFVTEMSLLDYRLSIHFSVSTIAFSAVVILRLILKKCLEFAENETENMADKSVSQSSEETSTTLLEESYFLDEVYKREKQLIDDIKINGVLNAQFQNRITETGKDNIVVCMTGIATLWRSILGQEKIIAIVEKFCRQQIQENFDDFRLLCLYGAPTTKDIEKLFL